MPFTETGNLDKGSGLPGKLVDLDSSHDSLILGRQNRKRLEDGFWSRCPWVQVGHREGHFRKLNSE